MALTIQNFEPNNTAFYKNKEPGQVTLAGPDSLR
jgi:hypothetical protein